MKRSEIDWTSCKNTRGAMDFEKARTVKGVLDAGRSKGQRFSPIVKEVLFFPTMEEATFVVDTFKGAVVLKVWIFTSMRGRQLLPCAVLRKTPDIPEECTKLFRDPENSLGDRLSIVGISDLEMLDDLYGKDVEVFEKMEGHLYRWEKDANDEWHRAKDEDGEQLYDDATFWKYRFVSEDDSEE